MDVMEKIRQLRQRHKQNSKNSCPTAILLYIATERQCPKPVDPWYSQIKKLSRNANRHYADFHRAVIFGMYPELKGACDFFNASLNNALKSNEKLSDENLLQIEKNTIKKYNLPESYFIGSANKDQQQRIDVNLASAMNKYVNASIKELYPAVQVIAHALKDTLSANKTLEYDFVKHMKFVDMCLHYEENFYKNKSIPPQEISHTVEQLFDMKKKGLLDKDFQILDYEAFKESPLLKSLPYQGKKHNIVANLMPRSYIAKIKKQFTWEQSRS